MSPIELVAAVLGVGADVKVEKGQAKITGPKLPEAVVEAIRADKAAFLEAWKDELASRFRRVPEGPMPMVKTPPKWTDRIYRRVGNYLWRQGDPCAKWLFDRGNAYVAVGLSVEVGAKCACRDLLYWQLKRHDRPEEILEGMEECVKGKR